MTIPEVSLADLLLTRTDGFGDKPALIDGVNGRSCTFREFTDAVMRVAGGLSECGFKKGDALVLMCPNCIEYAVAFLAVTLIGGTNTTLSPVSTSEELARQANDADADYLLTTPELLEGTVRQARRVWKHTIAVGTGGGTLPFEKLLHSSVVARATSIDPSRDVAVLPYSSGTTGVSKGVMLTHRNLVANLLQIADGMFTSDDTILGLAPFFHIYGLTAVLLLGLYLGSTNVILPRFEIPLFTETVACYRISYANLVPPLVVALAKHAELDAANLLSLKIVQSGAAPLPLEAARSFSERFDCRVLQSYGLTEASPVTHFVPSGSGDIPIESVGPPAPETECQILDPDTQERVGPGRQGELYVRGPQVMRGYLNDSEKTASSIDTDGWLRTGDIVWADEEGNFFVVDRAKELIKYKAYPIAPAELEAILLSHPFVRDAAVVGIPDDAVGELPKAFVVADSSLKAGALMSWVAQRVAPHKRIRRIEFVQTIPKSPSGKVLRRSLRDRAREEDAR